MPVVLGSDVLFERDLLKGRRVGLVCHPASINARFEHVVDAAERCGVHVGALFGPQHGFRADVQENMIETGHAQDPARAIPVYSLYSETREPTRDMLDGLDVLVIDLQDVGTRIYTYIYTMANCLRAAAKHGLPVVVCDRPNPIGSAVEGPMLDAGYESFVGQFSIPMRHGMTIGELANLFNEHFSIGAKLEVVAMKGWNRARYFDDAGLPWVLPSPNLPTLESAIVYPGTVLLEGTNISEGRGTTKPFELVGAPWVDPEAFSKALNARQLPGVWFRPALFEPTFHKHAGKACGGCQIHITDREAFRAVATGVELTAAFWRSGPDAFTWREPPYEYEYDRPPIDILYGSPRLREALVGVGEVSTLAERWADEVAAFLPIRNSFLLDQQTVMKRSNTPAPDEYFEQHLVIAASPSTVFNYFFSPDALRAWWQAARSVTTPVPFGVYAIEWATTPYRDEVLGALGGVFHGTVVDVKHGREFLVAEAFWVPPEGDPIGPMALQVSCVSDPAGGCRLSVRQDGYHPSPRWKRYYGVVSRGWQVSLIALKRYAEDQ